MEGNEDLKDLQFLVSNKQQKTYIRMVSQEFSCAESHVPVQGGRQRRRSKKSSSSSINNETEECIISSSEFPCLDPLAHVLGNDKDGSDESEYFSAEEDHDECFLETFSGDNSDDQVEIDPVNEKKKTSMYTLKSDNSSRHSKGRSKKQKKKRKGKEEGPLLAFGNASYLDVDFVDLNEKLTQPSAKSVFTEVPSLVELAIFASRKLPQSKQVKTFIPGAVKSIFKLSNKRLGLQKIQLSWLLKMIPLIEKELSFSSKSKRKLAYRNIWCSEMYSKELFKDMDVGHFYKDISATCYLPYTLVWTSQVWEEINHLINTFQLSAMANLIDFMLPPTVPHKSMNKKRRSSCQSEEDMISADTERMLLRIRSELEKKFPRTIKELYPQALPYTFWARGLLPKAPKHFSDLASKEKFRMKARYLYEVGRMYSHFDEPDTAIAFYRGAEDAVLAKSKNRVDNILREVEQQTRALCADAYDQGPMTPHKAQKAVESWNLAIHFAGREQLKSPHPGMYAADSLLCFHAGIGRNDVQSWLQSCIENLEKISNTCPQVYFYLSQIYAWAGKSTDSSHAIRTYRHSGHINSTDLNQRTSQASRQTWKVLLQTVQSRQFGTPRPLSVLWRTRLGPPRFYNIKEPQGSWEADIRGINVNLTLSQDGKITGDFQMTLPPIRGVQLDPHTGVLCFPCVPTETMTWHSFYEFILMENYSVENTCGPTLLPTPVELYCDNRGNRVHLLCSTVMVSKNHSGLDTHLLIWTGADGRRSKVNLDAKIRNAVCKVAEKKLHTFNIDEVKLEECKQILKKCCETGKVMNPLNIRCHVQVQFSKKIGDRAKFSSPPFTCTLKYPACCSSTIVIPVFIQPNQADTDRCFVFLDCSSLETFLEPKVCVRNYGQFYTGEEYSNNLTTPIPNMPHADIVPLYDSNRYVTYFDKYGEEFDRVDLSDVKQECGIPQVYRNLVYYVNQENGLVRGLNGDGMVIEHIVYVNKMTICRNLIIMVSLEKLIFADAINCLPLEVLLTDTITPSLPNGVDCSDNVHNLKVIGEKEIVKDSGKYNQVAIAMDTHLVVVEVPLCEDMEFIEMTMCVEVSGTAKDVCFISSHGGVLVSVASEMCPRETLHHFDSNGHLIGLLPGLGKGPRSFLTVMLPLNCDWEEAERKVWHIYMRDGHDGILCVALD
ncbi:uncharacterized protein [Argopecten irradians]|uniref:uncharacterized protein n=1 Tax=Argopecten irradians TaxID=31199 RepID=UPI003716E739